MELRPGERLDDLGRSGLRIIQHPGRSPFALDAVLLAHFARVTFRQRVLDLGTGGGIVPLLLAGIHAHVRVTGLEIQPDMVEMARRSVALNCLEERIRIDCGDYREVAGLYGHGSFDVVTLNPPYRRLGRGAISPVQPRAIARHEISGRLEDAIGAATTAVKFGGRVAVVFLAERLADLMEQMRTQGLEPKRLRMVHPRAGKPANLVLLEAVKGGGGGLTVAPPLAIHADGQNYTEEMQAIYDA